MHGFITDPNAPGGLRLADDLPEPEPAANEVLMEVHAYGINRGELFLLKQRADGWRPGQDVSGVVVHTTARGPGRVASSLIRRRMGSQASKRRFSSLSGSSKWTKWVTLA
jgi:NADPH:quinone reductase-like Zn-dependent oxidoreductase